MTYFLFIEQWAFVGPSTRPFQRTNPLSAVSDKLAIIEATEFVEGLFLVSTVKKVVAHLQRADGHVLKVIEMERETVGGTPKQHRGLIIDMVAGTKH